MNHKIISKITAGALLCSVFAYTTPVMAYVKEETVYSKLDASGGKYQTIVNNHIKNTEEENVIKDISDLLNIKNVNGDEEFTQEENNLIWKAEGKDIYYQGDSQKELPIECKITYELDGKEITAKDLAGKSGKVKIKIEYSNKDEHIVKINGKNQKLYTPFVVVCGTILDNTKNKNIEITNGKAIDDGSKTMVMGISIPGLQESLNISKEKIDIPNTIEITMDSTDFECNPIIAYVTPKIIEDSDVSFLEDIEEIYKQVDTLQKASQEIENGANTLKDGANTYYEKSQEFNQAMKQVADGVNNANENYTKVNDGIETLNKNSTTLQTGAKNISNGTEAISTNLKTISEKLGELQTGTKTLQAGEKQLDEGLDKMIAGTKNIDVTDNTAKITELETLVKANQSTMKTLKTTNETLKTQLKSQTDEEAKATLQKQIESNTALINLLEKNIEANQSIITTLKQTDTTAIKELKNGLDTLKQGMTKIKEGTEALYNGELALKSGTDTLVAKTEELSEGTKSLYQGTVKLSEGTKTLNTGSNEMKKGLNTLDKGTEVLTQANNQLTQGASTLSEGATTLATGISEFNKEGIQTICNYINGDVKEITTRLEKLQELAEEYNHFTMINDGNNGNVKFIMIIDGIKKEEDSKQEMIIEEKQEKSEKESDTSK